MRGWMVGMLLLGACRKTGASALAPSGSALRGMEMARDRDVLMTCRLVADPASERVWLSIRLENLGTTSKYFAGDSDPIWTHAKDGRAYYILGAPSGFDATPPREALYATLGPGQTRNWTLDGVAMPTSPTPQGVHDWTCMAAEGPDGVRFMQAGGRAVLRIEPMNP